MYSGFKVTKVTINIQSDTQYMHSDFIKRKTVNESNKLRYKKARSDLDGDLSLALAFLGLLSHSEGVNVVVA